MPLVKSLSAKKRDGKRAIPSEKYLPKIRVVVIHFGVGNETLRPSGEAVMSSVAGVQFPRSLHRPP